MIPHNFPHPFSTYAYNLRFNEVNERLNLGEDVNQLDQHNETALHKAIMRSGEKRSQEDINDSIEMVRLLLNRGANVNLQSPMGRTPIHSAIYRKCDIRVIELMLNKEDCDLTLTMDMGSMGYRITACHLAALTSLEYLECCYKREPDLVNWRINDVTMMQFAASSGKQEILNFLSKITNIAEADLLPHQEFLNESNEGFLRPLIRAHRQDPEYEVPMKTWILAWKILENKGQIVFKAEEITPT
jgi:ankyrin repeat protein